MDARLAFATLALSLTALRPAWAPASDEPDELLSGKLAVVRRFSLVKVIARPSPGFHLPGLGNDPRVEGARLHVFDTIAGPVRNDDEYWLPPPRWRGLGLPPGSGGFKYTGAGSGSDPCRSVLVKPTLVKAVCKGPAITLNPPFLGEVGVVLTVGTDSKRYCASFGGSTTRNDAGQLLRRNAPAPPACPVAPPPPPTTSTTTSTSAISTTSTSVTTTSSTSSTSSSTVPSCCGPARITLTSTTGTLELGNLLPAFPFPPGVLTTMDTAAVSLPYPDCRHPVVVPAGGFSVSYFGIPALGYCSLVEPLGCAAGSGVGGGSMWDGNGTSGLALANVTAVADTADGVCDATAVSVGVCSGGARAGLPCASSGPPDCPGFPCTGASGCTTATAGANTDGDIDATFAPSPGGGVRSVVEIPVHSLTWSDSSCTPTFALDCCSTQTYNPFDGDFPTWEWETVLRLTTGTGTAQFVDKNGNVCRRAGAGFQYTDGPASLTGSAAAGPCCVVGQATTVVSVGIAFSGGGFFYDLGFKSTIPSTVASCGAFVAGSCTVATDPCLQ